MDLLVIFLPLLKTSLLLAKNALKYLAKSISISLEIAASAEVDSAIH